MKEMITRAGQPRRTTHHVNSAKPENGRRHSRLVRRRRIIGVELHISRHEQVEQSVMIVIAPSGAGGPTTECHSRLLANVRKSPVVLVVVEPILAVVSNINIRPTIFLIITHASTTPPP